MTATTGDTLFDSTVESSADPGVGSLKVPPTVRFDSDNGVGRAWAALGGAVWPVGLLDARVLARQLQVNKRMTLRSSEHCG